MHDDISPKYFFFSKTTNFQGHRYIKIQRHWLWMIEQVNMLQPGFQLTSGLALNLEDQEAMTSELSNINDRKKTKAKGFKKLQKYKTANMETCNLSNYSKYEN